MRKLLVRRGEDPAAAEAVESFVYSAKKHIGAFAALLGGLDTLVFTGGVGEHAAAVRREIVRDLGFLGIELDPARNDAGAAVISAGRSRVVVRVMETREMLELARHTRDTLAEPVHSNGSAAVQAAASSSP
jgi:acetate kinase